MFEIYRKVTLEVRSHLQKKGAFRIASNVED